MLKFEECAPKPKEYNDQRISVGWSGYDEMEIEEPLASYADKLGKFSSKN